MEEIAVATEKYQVLKNKCLGRMMKLLRFFGGQLSAYTIHREIEFDDKELRVVRTPSQLIAEQTRTESKIEDSLWFPWLGALHHNADWSCKLIISS